MKFNAIDGVEDALILLGIAVSIDQIETIFGIVLLSIQILLLLTKGIIAIRKYLKNKDLDGAIKQVEETSQDIKRVVDEHKKKDGK